MRSEASKNLRLRSIRYHPRRSARPLEMDAGRIAVRVLFAYVFMLALIRVSGKRAIAQGTPLDFVLALIIGDLFDDLFWGEVSAATLVAASGSLVFLHVMLAALEAKFIPLARLLQSTPRLILANGAVIETARAGERVSECDLHMLLRE